jgi:DNA-binding MarR family transcriptional regulator
LLSNSSFIVPQQESLGFLVSDVSRLMRRAFQRRLADGSLTLAQARALIYVSRHEGIRQVDLADLLELQPMTLARLIDQLAAARLVERRADLSDRRAHRIFLTPAAAPQLAAIDQVVIAVRKQAAAGLDRAQVAALMSALATMRDNLSDR